jgi:hypothetical protein
VTEKTIQRYLKVKALADGGEGGEKGSARLILTKMEKDFPGVDKAAAAYRAKQAAGHPVPPPQKRAGRVWNMPGNWENIFRYAAGFYQTVSDVVEDVTDAIYGRVLVEEEVEFKAGSRKDHVYIRVQVPFTTLEVARELNAVQKEAFRQAMHQELDRYVIALLGEEG